MKIQGSFEVMAIEDLIQWARRAQKTGTLIANDGISKEIRVRFMDGRVMSSSTSAPRETYSNYLLQLGLCSEDDVIWAMGTRCDPQNDIEVNKKTWSSVIDPLVFGDILYNPRAQIDACKSYEHYHDFPPVAETTPEYKRVMLDKYGDLFKQVIGDDIFGL